MVENPVVGRILPLITPIVDDLGLELYDVEFAGGVLKITVDTPPGSPGGVDVDQLSRCTRLVSREMDHSDPIPGHYTLEVSSPGLERSLRLPRHFQREIGKSVIVRLRNAQAGQRRISGLLVAATEDSFTVRLDDASERHIGYDDVDKARTVFVWEIGPKTAPKGRSKSKSPASPADSQAENDGSTVDDFDDDTYHDDREHADS